MIYCVEDDESIREIEVYALQSTGFEAAGFADGAAFFEAAKKQTPQLVLLDVMLPGEDGVAILKKLRAAPATRSVPVIMATARGAEYDKIASLDLGADDYLVKPFGMMEMVARVKAVLRRGQPEQQDNDMLSFPGLTISLSRYEVLYQGKQAEMPPKEIELFYFLASHPNTVFTREQLLEKVWGFDYFGDSRTVDVHVKRLREKLTDCEELGWSIKTVWSVGYKFEVK